MKPRNIMVCLVSTALAGTVAACGGEAPPPPRVTVTETVTVTSPAPVQPTTTTAADESSDSGVGKSFTSDGAVVKILSARAARTIDLDPNQSDSGSSLRPRKGAKFVVIRTRATNNTKESMDLTCSLPISEQLVDDAGRKFDAIEDLYEIKGNPECNESLQPGFADEMTWAYEVPTGATITSWIFVDMSDDEAYLNDEYTTVALPNL